MRGARLPGCRPSATVAAKIRGSEIQRESRGPHHVIFLSRRVQRDATHRARACDEVIAAVYRHSND